MRKDPQEYFQTLGLSPGAGPTEIRRAYRQMMQRWHPDLFKPGSPMQTTAEDMAKEINEAYEQLYRKKLYRRYLPKPDHAHGAEGQAGAQPEPAQAAAQEPEEKETGDQAPATFVERIFAVLRKAGGLPWIKIGLGGAAAAAVVMGFFWVRQSFEHSMASMEDAPPSPAAAAVAPAGQHTPEPATPVPGTVARDSSTAAPEEASARSEQGRVVARIRDRQPEPRMDSPTRSASYSMPQEGTRTDHKALDPLERERLGASARPQQSPSEPAQSLQTEGAPIPPVAKVSEALEPDFGAQEARMESMIADAEAALRVVEVGDTIGRVFEIQGMPDGMSEHLLRYGSSLYYVAEGRITGWWSRTPRLKVRAWTEMSFARLDGFEWGSSLDAVVRAQGLPDSFTTRSYRYGSSLVFFDGGRVSGWVQGNTRLNRSLLPALGYHPFDPFAVH